MRKFLLLFFIVGFIQGTEAQSCIPTNINGSVFNLYCGQNCTNLSFQVPHLKSTTDYIVSPAPYQPYPYVTPSPALAIACPSLDDKFFDVTPLPFSFCYFGQTFNSLVVSTNGLITFDASNALKTNTWGLTTTSTLPSTGSGTQSNIFPGCQTGSQTPLFPKACIMAPYYDIDISQTTSPNRKMEVSFVGTAPCRKAIISFFQIPLFSCTLAFATEQVVLNESTGIVNIYIGNKPSCAWNGGLAVLGMQNFNRDKAAVVPGRNSTVWSATNEGWNFIPNGGTSRFVSSQLFTLGGTFIANADTSTITDGYLNLAFNNICPPNSGANQYVVKTSFATCSVGDPDPLVSNDTITINRFTTLPVTATPTTTVCGTSTGTITVNIGAGAGTAPFQFSINGGPLQASNVFTGLAAGTYSIFATDATGCQNTIPVIVGTTGIAGTALATATSCPGVNNGTITVTPSTGTAPYQYSLTGGPPYQASNVFTGLAAGTYTVTCMDANNCSFTKTVTIGAGAGITANSSSVDATCAGVNNGSITITPTSGMAPYQYSVDGGGFQLSNILTGLAPGNHTVVFQDASGCQGTKIVFVGVGSGVTATTSATDASCAGAANGSIVVNPTSGTAPYQYSLNGGPFQLSNTFSGLISGNYTVTYKDANNCTGSATIFVGAGSGITATTIVVPPSCTGASNGSITINPSSGLAPYQYSLNGGPNQLSNVFSGLAAASYTIVVTDAVNCTGTFTLVVPAGSGGINANAITTATSCPGVNNGTITINPTNGLAPYQYSLNGGPFQLSNLFSGLAPGSYTINYKDAINCSGTSTVTIASGSSLLANTSSVNPPCSGINNGTITVNPSTGTAPYQYSLNGGPLQASNTFAGLAAPATYNISFTDAIGCSGTVSVSLTANTAISTTVGIAMPLCFAAANGSVTLNPSGGVTPFQYSINAGATYQPSNIFNTLTAGTYTFRIKDNAGCTKDTTVTLTQPTLLTATAVPAVATCNGTDGTLTLTAGGGTAPYQYSVDNGVTYQASNSFTLAAGNYNNILIKDANDCIANTTATVTLVDAMFLNAGADTTVCVGSGVTLQPQTNPQTSVFTWTPATGLSSASVKNPVASPTDTTTYYLTATWGACTRKDTIVVNVLHKPVPYAGKDTAICDQSFALLKGSATNLSGGVTYAWTPAATVTPSNAAAATARPTGTQVYTLTVKDAYSCNFIVTDDVLVTMQPPVPAYAGNDTTAVVGVPHQLFGSGGVSYLWSPSSPLNNPFAQNPLATLYNDTYFNVQVTDVAGCVGNDGVFIKVYQGPTYYLPNAFSPNGDGLNDVFRPTPVGIVSTEFFRVFNRYGELMFETNKWLQGWDGMYKGKKQQTGAYVWTIKGTDKNGKIVEMRGTVILVR